MVLKDEPLEWEPFDDNFLEIDLESIFSLGKFC
jgi:hypothetical protein